MKFYALIRRSGSKKLHIRTGRDGDRYSTACGQTILRSKSSLARTNSANAITCYECLVAGASGRVNRGPSFGR